MSSGWCIKRWTTRRIPPAIKNPTTSSARKEAELIRKAAHRLVALRFDTHTDRSVLATLNTVRNNDLAALLWQVPNVLDPPPYSVSAQLSQRPVHLKGMRTSDCLWPDRAMPELLQTL